MFLYDLLIQRPSSINNAALGHFSGTKYQELIVSRGNSALELLRLDPSTGKLNSLLVHDVFGVIRCLSAFKLIGSSKGICLCLLCINSSSCLLL